VAQAMVDMHIHASKPALYAMVPAFHDKCLTITAPVGYCSARESISMSEIKGDFMRFLGKLFVSGVFITVFVLSAAVSSGQTEAGKTIQQSDVNDKWERDGGDRRNEKAMKVVQEFLLAFQRQDLGALIDLIDDRVVFEQPFTLDGSTNPTRLEGKDAAVGYLQGLFNLFSQTNLTRVNNTVAEDTGTVFVEMQGDFIARAINYRYQNVYITKFQVRRGKIVRSVEYANPIIFLNLQRALGQ